MKSAALLLLLLGRGAIDAGQDRWKIDFKVSLEEKEGRWSFVIEGTTDLPAGAVLSARIYVLDIVNDPIQGPVEDDSEPLVGREDDFQPAYHSFKVGPGPFRERVHRFRRKPYSISYRAKVQYSPDDQTDALSLKIGNDPFFRKADLRVGSDAEYAAELRARVGEIGRDLVSIEKIAGELADWISRARKEPDAWAAWRTPAIDAIGTLQDRNLQRFKVWAVWAEYQGRMRIEGLTGFLERMIEALDDPDSDEKRTRRWMAGVVEMLDEAYTVVGYEPPLDPRKAGPALAAYEKVVASLLDGKRERIRSARTEGLSAIFDLLRLLRNRPRGYTYVNTVSARFVRVFELLDDQAPPEQLKEAFRQHDAALREFRTFADLK